MTAATALVLRDIHRPDAPSWWPPAPGWWILAVLVIAVVVAATWWQRRRAHRARLLAALFDDAVATAATAPARVAAMSELLRRASRRRRPDADRLQGEAWLDFLDGDEPARHFSRGAGRLVLDGGFRPDVPEADVAALQSVARARFLDWMRR